MNNAELEIVRFCSRVVTKLSPFPDLRKNEKINQCIFLSGKVISEIVEIELEGLDRDSRLERVLSNLKDLKKSLDDCNGLVDMSLMQYDPDVKLEDLIKALR